MKIAGKNFKVLDTFDSIVTIPDCFVVRKNKLGKGNGEAKLYFGTKTLMREFFGDRGFEVKCFILKNDLITFLNALKQEYTHPSLDYCGKDVLAQLWEDRMRKVELLEDIIYFNVKDQTQIEGPRGYVNSKDKAYSILRELSLPLVSYIAAMKVKNSSNEIEFYWKLFVDFDAISEIKNGALVFKYGKKEKDIISSIPKSKQQKSEDIRKARVGQGKYRELLLEECPFCPITMVNDERLLIASHIKPWAFSDDKEKIDPKNGFMLTPLYDKLFDRGFITFTEDKHMLISDWLSPKNKRRLQLKDNSYFQHLPIDDARLKYLKYHQELVFKG